MPTRTWCRAACSLALVLLAQTAWAGSFAVTPLRVTLTQDQPTGMLVVRNLGAEETVVQLQPRAWSQEGGADRLRPTNDLLAVPPLFTLAPGGSQVVRLGLRLPPRARGESTYRLLLREVPPPPPDGFTGLQVALNVNLPVFAVPPGGARPELRWLLRRVTGGLELGLSNLGNAHVQIKSFCLSRDDTTVFVGRDLPVYLLPGQSRSWRFDAAAANGQWSLLVRTDADPTETELVLALE